MVLIQWYISKLLPMQLPPMMISTQNLQSLHNRSNRQFAIQKKTKIVEVAKSKFLSHELPPILTPLPCAIFLPKTPFLLTTVILREKTNATTIVSVYVLDRQTQGHLEIKIVSLLFKSNRCLFVVFSLTLHFLPFFKANFPVLVHIHFIKVCLVGNMNIILIDEMAKRLLKLYR